MTQDWTGAYYTSLLVCVLVGKEQEAAQEEEEEGLLRGTKNLRYCSFDI